MFGRIKKVGSGIRRKFSRQHKFYSPGWGKMSRHSIRCLMLMGCDIKKTPMGKEIFEL